MLSNNGKNVSVKTIDFSKAKKEFSIETTEPKVNDTNISSENNVNELKENFEKLDGKIDSVFSYLDSFKKEINMKNYDSTINSLEEKVSKIGKDKSIEVKSASKEDIIELKEMIKKQNAKIDVLSKDIEKNLQVEKIKANQATVIKNGVEESFSKLIQIKNSPSEDFKDLKESHLELDRIVKENNSKINLLNDSLESTVTKTLEKKVDSLTMEEVEKKINEKEKRNEMVINKQVSELKEMIMLVSNKIDSHISSIQSEKEKETEEEIKKADEIIKEADKIAKEKKEKAEKEALAAAEKAAVEKAAAEKAAAEKAAAEKAAAEKAAAEKAAAEKAAAEKKTPEEKATAVEKVDDTVCNEDLFKNTKIYPNAGFTLYLLLDRTFEIKNDTVIGIFINGELRGKSSEFIDNGGRYFATININLKNNDEKIDKMLLYSDKIFFDSKNLLPDTDKLLVGENNLHLYPNLPIIYFTPQ